MKAVQSGYTAVSRLSDIQKACKTALTGYFESRLNPSPELVVRPFTSLQPHARTLNPLVPPAEGKSVSPSLQLWQYGQRRFKMTVKTTTKTQRFSLEIKPKREAAIRDFWEVTRGVQDLACLHRFANFARIYPRYRDLDYLRIFMPQWDFAIERLIQHDRGMHPANELARKHPFILNCKLEPLRWAKLAVRGRLPVYTWNTVLTELKCNTGAEESWAGRQGGFVKLKSVNTIWRAPGFEDQSQNYEEADTSSDDELDLFLDESSCDRQTPRPAAVAKPKSGPRAKAFVK